MSIAHTFAATLLVASLATGCTARSFTNDERAESATDIESELAEGRHFDISASLVEPSSDAELVASGVWIDEAHTAFTLDVGGGSADVILGEAGLELRELTVRLEGFDHEIPGGSRFTDMALVLEHPVALETELVDGSVMGAADLALRLDWSIATDTATLPLVSQDVPALPITLHIQDDGEGLHLEAELSQDGFVFELDDLFVVERLDVNVAATSLE